MREQVKEFFKNEIQNYNNFISQVRSDSLGRFFTSKDGRKNQAVRLGKEIYSEEQFIDYLIERIEKEVEHSVLAAAPSIYVFIGCPGSGKSTYLKTDYRFEDAVIISRDETVIQFGKDNNILGNYSAVWKALTDAQQKEVDAIVQVNFKAAVKDKRDIVIDMTNMSRKSRRKWLANVSKDYRKEAIVLATGYDEIWSRLEKREKETGKAIPGFAVMNMMKGFMVPSADEVHDTTWVFS